MKTSSSEFKQVHSEFSRSSLYVFSALIACVAFFSCGDAPTVITEHFTPPAADSIQSSSEKTVSGDLTSLLNGISIANINQYIHPEKGLWLIQSNGAMPALTLVNQVDKNFPVDFSSVKKEELPKVNCDSRSFWTKEGCFVQEINTFKDEKIWTVGSGLEKSDEVMFEERAKTISWTVINTALYARYYFSKIDGKWYLVFVDLRRPCEA